MSIQCQFSVNWCWWNLPGDSTSFLTLERQYCGNCVLLFLSHSPSGPPAAIAVATRSKAGTQVLHISLGKAAGLILVQKYREIMWNDKSIQVSTNPLSWIWTQSWSWALIYRIYRNATSHHVISELSGPICGVWAPNLPSRSPPQDVPHKSFTHRRKESAGLNSGTGPKFVQV